MFVRELLPYHRGWWLVRLEEWVLSSRDQDVATASNTNFLIASADIIRVRIFGEVIP
jgi:hypothetical protein